MPKIRMIESENFPDGFVYIKPDPKYNRAKWGNRGSDFGSFTGKLYKHGNTYTGVVYVQGALREFSTDGNTGYFRDTHHRIPVENVDYAALWKECHRIFRMNKDWMGIQHEAAFEAKRYPGQPWNRPPKKKRDADDNVTSAKECKTALDKYIVGSDKLKGYGLETVLTADASIGAEMPYARVELGIRTGKSVEPYFTFDFSDGRCHITFHLQEEDWDEMLSDHATVTAMIKELAPDMIAELRFCQ